jgi:N-acetylmuramoyl-L-alanine amidase
MKAIFLDAGHGKNVLGAYDYGACRIYHGQLFKEREFAKDIVSTMKNILSSKEELKGCLIQTVGLETDTTPAKKMAFINQTIRENRFPVLSCLSVSIHMNSVAFGEARGFEVWRQKRSATATLLADEIVKAWGDYKILPLRPRPVMSTSLNSKWHRLYIDDAVCPAVLAEVGFISNFNDLSAVKQDTGRVAECLAHGILSFIRNNG